MMSEIFQIAAFIALVVSVLALCISWVGRNIRVQKNAIFWYLSGEIERQKDPVSYWFFAGQIVLLLALIPTFLIYQLVFSD